MSVDDHCAVIPRISAGTKGSGPDAKTSVELGGMGKSAGNSLGSETLPPEEGIRTSHPASATSASTSAATCRRLSTTLCGVPVQTDRLASKIRDVPDFPKPGILFKDITTLLKDGDSFAAAIDGLLAKIGEKKIDVVVGMESRGFIFAAPIAYKLGVGFVPVRKLGKLPGDVVSVEYDLEYGSATLEMHKDAIKPGARVLIVDDLLATGGTVAGTIELVKQLKGEIVGLAFLIEIAALKGRDKLAGYEIATLIKY